MLVCTDQNESAMQAQPMNPTTCPPEQLLRSYLSGKLSEDDSFAVQSHLEDCTACERTATDLEQDPDTVAEILRNLDTVEHSEEGDSGTGLSAAKGLLPVSHHTESPLEIVGSEIGAYQLLRQLGRGGMGTVYLARHTKLGKEVAIKLLPAQTFRSEMFAARFQREIRAAGGLEHPAIIRSTDAGEQSGTHFLVMEFIDGLDLSRVARLTGPLRIADACEIGRQVALGLSHAHASGVVHRDIKPSNLMLSQTGETKILDFGLAMMGPWDEQAAELTTVGQLMGTLDYMAPEQAERAEAVDYRADLYSLGATLFRLLCGRAPLAATPNLSPLAKLRLLATHDAPKLHTVRDDIPEELTQLIDSLLDRDPAKRPPSAAHVAQTLEGLTDEADLECLIREALSSHQTSEEDAISPEPKLSPASDDSPMHGGFRVRWIAAAALVPLAILGGVLITLELLKGQLVVSSDVGDISVSVLKDGEFYRELQIKQGTNSTRLYAGKYEVRIDEGSDSISIDQQKISIRRGDLVVARVSQQATPTTDSASSEIAAANEALADATSSLARSRETESSLNPLLPTQSTVKELKEHRLALEMQLNLLAAEVGYGHPKTSELERLIELTDQRIDFTQKGRTSDPLYEGKPLSEWLATISVERSPTALGRAFDAIKALVSEATSDQITTSFLRDLPTVNGGTQIRSGESRTLLDYVAFEVLSEANPDEEFAELLLEQLDTGSLKWQKRILDRSLLVDPIHYQRLADWIHENLLSKQPVDESVLHAGAFFYVRYIDAPALSDESKRKLLSRLEVCDQLSDLFWIGNIFTTYPPLLDAIETRAIRILANDDSSANEVAIAANRLNVNFESRDKAGKEKLVENKRIKIALKSRIANLESSELTSFVKLEESDAGGLSNTSRAPTHFRRTFRTSISKFQFNCRLLVSANTWRSQGGNANLAILLLGLAKNLGTTEIESSVNRIFAETSTAQHVVENRIRSSGERDFTIRWPTCTVATSNRPRKSAGVPSKDEIVGFFINELARTMLPPEMLPAEDPELAASNNTSGVSSRPTPRTTSIGSFRDPRRNSNEVLYQSKPLSEWLRLLPLEKSSQGLGEVFTALSALVTPGTREEITQVLLWNLPKLDGGRRLQNTGPGASVDTKAFALLKKANPGQAYYNLLVTELSTTEPSQPWRRRLLSTDVLSTPPRSLDDMKPYLTWLESEILSSPEATHDDLEMVASTFEQWVSAVTDSEVAKELIRLLRDSDKLGPDFWLSLVRRDYHQNSLDRRTPIGGRLWAQEVIDQAQNALRHPTSKELETEAFVLLYIGIVSREETALKIDVDSIADSVERMLEKALANWDARTRQVVADPSYRWLRPEKKVKQDLANAQSILVDYVTDEFEHPVRVFHLRQLLNFCKAFGHDERFEPHLRAMAERMGESVLKIEEAVRITPSPMFQSTEIKTQKNLKLHWPALSVAEYPAVPPEAWLDFALYEQVLSLLPDEVRSEIALQTYFTVARRQATATLQAMDRDIKKGWSYGEFNSFSKNWAISKTAEDVDLDGNEHVNVDEFIDFLHARNSNSNAGLIGDALNDWANRKIRHESRRQINGR